MEIGTHCSLETCQQLDFLPFICDACKQVFCKEHFSPEKHQCSCHGNPTKRPKSLDNTSREVVSNQVACDFIGCGRVDLVSIRCEHCHGNFCIAHRHPSDHSCPQLPTVSSVSVTKNNPPRNSSREHKGVGRRSEKCSQLVAMMRLKQIAKGPPSVAQSHRVYHNVTLPTGDTKPLYFSKEWSVGKVIDHIAAMFKLTNNCHQPSAAPRLRLFSSDDGTVLDVKLTLSSQLTSGSDIQLAYQ